MQHDASLSAAFVQSFWRDIFEVKGAAMYVLQLHIKSFYLVKMQLTAVALRPATSFKA